MCITYRNRKETEETMTSAFWALFYLGVRYRKHRLNTMVALRSRDQQMLSVHRFDDAGTHTGLGIELYHSPLSLYLWVAVKIIVRGMQVQHRYRHAFS